MLMLSPLLTTGTELLKQPLGGTWMTFGKFTQVLKLLGTSQFLILKVIAIALIVDIVYSTQRIYIKYVLTHAEYDKDKWKNDPYF